MSQYICFLLVKSLMFYTSFLVLRCSSIILAITVNTVKSFTEKFFLTFANLISLHLIFFCHAITSCLRTFLGNTGVSCSRSTCPLSLATGAPPSVHKFLILPQCVAKLKVFALGIQNYRSLLSLLFIQDIFNYCQLLSDVLQLLF